MSNFLGIGIYPKAGKKAGVVFRKHKNILYRITTIERVDLFIGKMYDYAIDLRNNREEPEFLIELASPRKRTHVLEIALADDEAELRVYEMMDGCAKLCFKWNGNREGLMDGLDVFTILTH